MKVNGDKPKQSFDFTTIISTTSSTLRSWSMEWDPQMTRKKIFKNVVGEFFQSLNINYLHADIVQKIRAKRIYVGQVIFKEWNLKDLIWRVSLVVSSRLVHSDTAKTYYYCVSNIVNWSQLETVWCWPNCLVTIIRWTS